MEVSCHRVPRGSGPTLLLEPEKIRDRFDLEEVPDGADAEGYCVINMAALQPSGGPIVQRDEQVSFLIGNPFIVLLWIQITGLNNLDNIV